MDKELPTQDRNGLTDVMVNMVLIRAAYKLAGSPVQIASEEMRHMTTPSNMDTFAMVLTQG